MTWTAPSAPKIEPPATGDERANLDGFLDRQRASLFRKCAGLTGEQLVERAVPPSTLSLLGLIRHLAEVERCWFRIRFARADLPFVYGSWDGAFSDTVADQAAEDFATLETEIDLARRAVADASLDDEVMINGKYLRSLRWIYTHMIEEYARHLGHADLLRERIDGATGV